MAQKKTKKKKVIRQPKIKNNYTIEKVRNDIEAATTLNSLLGGDTTLPNNLEKEFKGLSSLPDRFNTFFSSHGWIACESLNLEIMKEAVQLAESSNFKLAKQCLINQHSEEALRHQIRQLNNIEEMKPRIPLIQKALEDYLEERYHSTVPILLMMIDGFVNDLEQKGFFATGVNLTAWDSIAAHETGLGKLATIFGAARKKTRIEEIQLPYRNGILHGRDLGYANKEVASKCWSLLFATADWGRALTKVKNEGIKTLSSPTVEEVGKLLKDAIASRENTRKETTALKQWKRRKIRIGVQVPESGEASLFTNDTPEHKIAEFLNYLMDGNFGHMAKSINKDKKNITVGKLAGQISKTFSNKKLISYKLLNIQDTAASATNIEVELALQFETEISYKICTFRLLFTDDEGRPLIRNYHKGNWYVHSDFKYQLNN